MIRKHLPSNIREVKVSTGDHRAMSKVLLKVSMTIFYIEKLSIKYNRPLKCLNHIQHYKSNHIINTHLALYDQMEAFTVYFGLLTSLYLVKKLVAKMIVLLLNLETYLSL